MNVRAPLRWGYDRLWDKWPIMLAPMLRQFRRRNGYWPRLLRPRTFNEKVTARLLFDRRPLLPRVAGKLELRSFVRHRTGSDASLVPLLGVVRTPADLRAIDLPPDFIMKASHASGLLHIQRAAMPLDRPHLERLCAEWLANDYGKYCREWLYKPLQRAVIIEELMTEPGGAVPVDYKIFCYDGVPRIIHHVASRFHDKTQDLFDPDWTLIDLPLAFPPTPVRPPRPPGLAAMLDLAATLSRGIDFVRVDLYDRPDGPRVGELTMTPDGGCMPFPDPRTDIALGEPWDFRWSTIFRARRSASD